MAFTSDGPFTSLRSYFLWISSDKLSLSFWRRATLSELDRNKGKICGLDRKIADTSSRQKSCRLLVSECATIFFIWLWNDAVLDLTGCY